LPSGLNATLDTRCPSRRRGAGLLSGGPGRHRDSGTAGQHDGRGRRHRRNHPPPGPAAHHVNGPVEAGRVRSLRGVVDDISHEGLRTLLREEGVTFQRIMSWKTSADPDYAVKKARVEHLYAIADREVMLSASAQQRPKLDSADHWQFHE